MFQVCNTPKSMSRTNSEKQRERRPAISPVRLTTSPQSTMTEVYAQSVYSNVDWLALSILLVRW